MSEENAEAAYLPLLAGWLWDESSSVQKVGAAVPGSLA